MSETKTYEYVCPGCHTVMSVTFVERRVSAGGSLICPLCPADMKFEREIPTRSKWLGFEERYENEKILREDAERRLRQLQERNLMHTPRLGTWSSEIRHDAVLDSPAQATKDRVAELEAKLRDMTCALKYERERPLKRRFRLVPVDRAKLPQVPDGVGYEFEAEPGKNVYLVVKRGDGTLQATYQYINALGLPAEGIVYCVPEGCEVEAYELVPAESLDVVRSR